MKISVLVSLAATALACAGSASAQVIPGMKASAAECEAWANSQTDPVYRDAARNRCQAFKDCMRNESDNENSLNECFFTAETTFQASTASIATAPGPENPTLTPASTEVADSAYDHPERDKGWEFTNQGD